MIEKALNATGDEKTKSTTDPEPAWKNYPTGYPRLCERIAVKPETGIYRRFDALNARHLLYLQAELCILERRLRQQEVRDKKDGTGKRSEYAVDYESMLEEPRNQTKTQLEMIQQMHDKLNQYNKALIQISLLHKLHSPDRFDLHDIQYFVHSEDMGPDYLKGTDAGTWGIPEEPDNHPPDLVGVHPRMKSDKFSSFVSERAIYLFKFGLGKLTRGNRHIGRKVYFDSTVLKVTLWITSILASLLPIASILVLINLDSLKAKLWTIAAFNVAISACLNIFAEAKRAEVFAITAAFAAVQVVFVGTNGGPSG